MLRFQKVAVDMGGYQKGAQGWVAVAVEKVWIVCPTVHDIHHELAVLQTANERKLNDISRLGQEHLIQIKPCSVPFDQKMIPQSSHPHLDQRTVTDRMCASILIWQAAETFISLAIFNHDIFKRLIACNPVWKLTVKSPHLVLQRLDLGPINCLAVDCIACLPNEPDIFCQTTSEIDVLFLEPIDNLQGLIRRPLLVDVHVRRAEDVFLHHHVVARGICGKDRPKQVSQQILLPHGHITIVGMEHVDHYCHVLSGHGTLLQVSILRLVQHQVECCMQGHDINSPCRPGIPESLSVKIERMRYSLMMIDFHGVQVDTVRHHERHDRAQQ